MTTCVWAYKPLKKLHNLTGFVGVDDELAKRLLASGDVQDPRIGSNSMKHIQAAEEPVAEPVKQKVTKGYKTKVMTANVAAE